MFLLLLSGCCLLLTVGLGSMIFLVLTPVLFLKFISVVKAVIEIVLSLFQFYWEIFIFLLSVFMDIGHSFLNLFISLLPILMHYGIQISNIIVESWQIFRYQYIPQILNFAQQQTELFLLFWGMVVTTFYAFLNSIRIQNYGERVPGHMERRDQEENNDHFDDDADDIRHENAHQAGLRYRLQGRQRLYPDLGNTDNYRDNEDANQERNCVVCFERCRNTAVFPCGHTQTCLLCVRAVMAGTRRCPICQGRIVEFRQVYV